MRPGCRLVPPKAAAALALAFLATTAIAGAAVAAGPLQNQGFRVLTGADVAAFALPADVRQVWTWREPGSGLDFTRYQQFAAPLNVHVEGAQLTVVRRGEKTMLVIGAHFPGLKVAQAPALSAGAAAGRAATDRALLGPAALARSALLTRRAELRLEPGSGRLFYLVESGAPGIHLIHKIDAQTGALIDAWDGIDRASGVGSGSKGDRKTLLGADPVASLGSLTTLVNGQWRMQSADGSIVTLDAQGRGAYGAPSGIQTMSDAAQRGWRNDNDWKAGYQKPAVDAQYYAALTVAFYRQRLGFDMISGCPFDGIRNVVHYDETPFDGFGFDNAFWDGFDYYMVYGDGDGRTTRAMSAGQDVVSHELSHAVTQCRAELAYKDESGALNEAFSDIMASAAEWDFEEPLSSYCRLAPGQTRCADWLIGEDVIIDSSWPAFRDLTDPQAQGQPSHYGDRRFVGGDFDNGGVHYNAGIVNHAFYLLVNGGRNARCGGPTDPLADCDVFVPAISIADAERIFFTAFGTLPETADLCTAREATIATADVLFPGSLAQHAATDLAWAAVGRSTADCAAAAGFSIRLTSRSLAVAPGTSGKLQLVLTRGTQSGPITFSVTHAAPVTATPAPAQSPGPAPDDGTQITLDVPVGAAAGIYPFLIGASDGVVTRYASALLVIDGIAPTMGVSRVRFASGATVSAAGVVPLQVAWTAGDAESGIASWQLEHSPDAASWAIIYGPGAPASPTGFDAVDGPHYFRVLATDAVGNGAASAPFAATMASFQEDAVVYTGTWIASSATPGWGTTMSTRTRGATAAFNFSGTDVIWVAPRGPKGAKAKVYLDGSVTKVNLYSKTASERRVVFVASNLAPGQHTLRIVVTGSARRPQRSIDGFVVLNQ